MNKLFFNLISKIWNSIQYRKYYMRMKDLISRGLKIGKNVTIAHTAYIDYEYPFLISIGDNCTVSNNVRLLAHDASTFKFVDGYTRIGKIVINNNCYIGEQSIILPGVTVGSNVLIAAGSLVNKDIPSNSCVAGVPARFYAKFEDFIKGHKEQIKSRPSFSYHSLRLKMDNDLRKKIIEAVEGGDCYVKGYLGRYPFTLNNDDKEI
ncbi:MAG: acyltransferase [Nanoarchaeota archaeon]